MKTPSAKQSSGGAFLRFSARKVLLVVGDLLIINGALALTLAFRLDFVLSRFFWQHAPWFLLLSAFWLVIGLVLDIYNLARAASATHSLWATGSTLLLTSLGYLLVVFLISTRPSRGLEALLLPVLALAGLTVWRVSYAKVFVQPHFHQRVLIIGAGWAGQTLAQAIAATGDGDGNPYRGTGYRILGFVDDDPAKQGQEIAGIPVLGGHGDLVRLAQELRPDEVILALPHGQAIPDELIHAIFDCRELGIQVTAMASLYERMTGRVAVEYGGPNPNVVMSELPPRSRRVYLMGKRLFDIAVALIGCTLTAILSPLIWLANRWTAPGDLFYRQKCRGAGGQCFQMVTFRSMAVNAEQSTGVILANENGSRVTPMGRILRKTKLDEIPQFWNVLRDEMSLIGPRPVVLDQLTQEIPFYRVRYAVKPGITGWAQVKYNDGAAPLDALVELQYDLYYIKYQGLYLDLLILLKTMQVGR